MEELQLAQDFAAEVTHTSRQAAPAHTEMELAFELLPADAVAGTRPRLPMRPSFVVMWRRRCGACSLVRRHLLAFLSSCLLVIPSGVSSCPSVAVRASLNLASMETKAALSRACRGALQQRL